MDEMAMPPLVRLDPVALRVALGVELVLREGQVIGGRLAEVRGRHGILVLRGAALVAELPPGLQAGQPLRLAVVGEADGKVLLRLAPEPAAQAATAAPAAPPVAPWVPLPGGARVRVEERDAREERGAGDPAAGGEARTVAVRFEGPSLGPVELRLDLDAAGTVRAVVRATPGRPLGELRDAAAELRRALGGDVRLEPRDEELDLRA
jgi:hypothetical protein